MKANQMLKITGRNNRMAVLPVSYCMNAMNRACRNHLFLKKR